LSIHRKGSPFADRGRGSFLARFDQLDDGVRSEAFVVIIIELEWEERGYDIKSRAEEV
jgi:hypothetical protein